MQAEQAAQLRNEFELDRRSAFMSRLEMMEMGSMMELLPAGDLQGEEAASAGSKIWRCQDGYSILGKDGSRVSHPYCYRKLPWGYRTNNTWHT